MEPVFAPCAQLSSGTLIPLMAASEERDQARDQMERLRRSHTGRRNYQFAIGRRIGAGRWHLATANDGGRARPEDEDDE